MKHIFSTLLAILLCATAWGQAPANVTHLTFNPTDSSIHRIGRLRYDFNTNRIRVQINGAATRSLAFTSDLPTFGNLTTPTTGVSITGGTGAVRGSGTAISIQNATTSQTGLLTNTDWNTFNNKQATGLSWLLTGTSVVSSPTIQGNVTFDGNVYLSGARDIGTNTSNTLNIVTNSFNRIAIGSSGDQTYTQNARTSSHTFLTYTQNNHTSGTPNFATWTGGTWTGATASAEATDINFNLARTVQFATGALATQRAFRIQAPTYSFVGASTITKATTLAISGAPVAGTNATITDAYALDLESGDIRLGSTPSNDDALTQVLVRDGSTGRIKYRTSGSLTGGGSGITVGTTTITSGTNTRIPYNDGGVYGEDAGLVYNETNDALTVGASRFHSTGTSNVFIGPSAGNFTLSGAFNTGLGASAGASLIGGSQNTFIGRVAGQWVTDGADNTLVGNGAGGISASLSLVDGDGNTHIGRSAGTAMNGDNNTFIGTSAGLSTTLQTASNNIAIGASAGTNSFTTAQQGVIIGYNIQFSSTTTNGQLSLQNAIYGTGNTATGTTVASGNIGFYANTWGTSAAKVVSVGSGTAPSTSITDGFQLYSADVSAANAALHTRAEGGEIISLGSETGTQSNHDLILVSNSVERLRLATSGAIGVNGTNYGTSGQVLTSNGSGSAPTWQTVSGGSGQTFSQTLATSTLRLF